MQGAANADWGENNKCCVHFSNTGGPHICRKLLYFRPTITFLLAPGGEVAKIGLKYQAVTIALCLPKNKFTSIQVHQQSTGKQSNFNELELKIYMIHPSCEHLWELATPVFSKEL